MIQVSIKNIKSQQTTNIAQFETQELAQEWVNRHSNMGSFGKLERLVPQSECSELELFTALELLPEVLGEDNQVISSAMARLACEFTVEITDITAELEQQKINEEALAFLAATDWMVIRAAERGEELSPEFKAERQAARDRIVR